MEIAYNGGECEVGEPVARAGEMRAAGTSSDGEAGVGVERRGERLGGEEEEG